MNTLPGQLDLFSGVTQQQAAREATAAGEASTQVERVALIACCGPKLSRRAPALELYTSPLFRKCAAYARRTCGRVYVLSAEHHLLQAEEWVEPYDKDLRRQPKALREEWGRKVAAQLLVQVPPPAEVLLLASGPYVASLPEASLGGYLWSKPLVGMRGIGDQLAWLNAALEELAEEERAEAAPATTCARCSTAGAVEPAWEGPPASAENPGRLVKLCEECAEKDTEEWKKKLAEERAAMTSGMSSEGEPC